MAEFPGLIDLRGLVDSDFLWYLLYSTGSHQGCFDANWISFSFVSYWRMCSNCLASEYFFHAVP